MQFLSFHRTLAFTASPSSSHYIFLRFLLRLRPGYLLNFRNKTAKNLDNWRVSFTVLAENFQV